MPARGIRTDAPVARDHDTVPVAEEAHPDTPDLAAHEVRLSDGRVVTLRETTAMDDARMEKVLTRAGYSMQGMGVMAYARACALASIESIDGRRPQPIRTPAELDATLMLFKTKDMNAIIERYGKLNGADADDATFRSGGDGA